MLFIDSISPIFYAYAKSPAKGLIPCRFANFASVLALKSVRQLIVLGCYNYSHLRPGGRSCWFHFSASGMVCQVGLPDVLVANHKGIRKNMLMVLVEKVVELRWKVCGSSMLQ